MPKRYAIANTKEEGLKAQFILGPYGTFMEAVRNLPVTEDGPELFVLEENKPPRHIDLNSNATQSF